MALSYISEGEAPRDFRVSSTESDTHYTKCLLCFNVRRNFYCSDCVRTGNFTHSSMPYSDRYSEKQAKIHRVKVNRKYVLDRCEKLLSSKIKKDKMLTEAKQSRDRLDLLRLAIEQRRNNIEEKKKELFSLKQHNHELLGKMPRYEKRVTLLGKYALDQRIELENKMIMYNEQVDVLAALRRSRIRQLTKYIFPVYISYDTSESIEDMEFVGGDAEEEPPKRPQLHIVNSWISTDGDFSHIQAWLSQNKESGSQPLEGASPGRRAAAGLALAAQLAALLAWTLDVRLPYGLPLSEFSTWRLSRSGVSGRWRRLQAACAALARHAPPAASLAPLVPPDPLDPLVPLAPAGHGPTAPAAPLTALHHVAISANADDPALGRPEAWNWAPERGECLDVAEPWGAVDDSLDEDNEPEYLHWPADQLMGTAEGSGGVGGPAAAPPAASLVTSLASLWRAWAN